MIKVFNGTDNTFSSNGDVVLNPTRAIVHKEDNGSFYLDLETNLNEETKIVEAEQGSTATINGSGQIQDVDTTKEVELTQVLGNTTQNGTPTPTTPIPISNVSGLQEVNICSKNLYNGENYVGYITSNGYPNSTDTLLRRTDYILIQPNTTYNVSTNEAMAQIQISFYSSNSYASFIQRDRYYNVSSQSFTSPNNAKYVIIDIKKDNNTTLDDTSMSTYQFQLEKGNTKSLYEPYKGNTYEINLGKNLFDITQYVSSLGNGWSVDDSNNFKWSGTTGAYVGWFNDYYLDIPSGTYTISGNYSNSANLPNMNSIKIRIMNANNTVKSTGYTATFNKENGEKFRLLFYKNENNSSGTSTSITETFNNVMLEKSNEATSYSPYFTPIELNKISTYKDYIFKGKGVNLFDKTAITEGKSVSSSNGGLYNDTNSFATDYIGVFGMSNVCWNGSSSSSNSWGAFYKEDKTFLSGFSTGSHSRSVPNGAYYFRLGVLNTYLDTLQVESGTSVSAIYEPYNAKDKWLLHKEIGKVVYKGDSSEGWNKYSGSKRFYTSLTDSLNPTSNSNIGKMICNRFITYSANDTSNNTTVDGISLTTTGEIDLRYVAYNNETLANFKTWLSSNNLIVYYVLANPTTEEITNSELLEDLDSIELLDGLNNIMITSSDLPATLDIHYNYVSGGEVKTSYIDYLVANNILVANTPQGNQAFRITNVDKTRSKIRLQANHIFYDSQNYVIKDSYVVEKNCNEALDHLNNATDSESPFTTTSNVNTINSFRCVRKSLYEAIQVILERWGGHLVRDNFEIKIMDTIGSDNQVVVRYGKNLKNIEAVYDWNAVATKLMPVGADGLLLPEEWLFANNSYEIPYTKVISFDQSNINQEDYADDEAYQQALIDDLRQKGNEYLATNSVPMVNYTLDANLEKISDVGDTIEVIDERLGINLLTHLISFDYNCLLDRYEQLQFGNFTPKLNDLMSTIAESTTQAIEENNAVIKVTLSNELQHATDRIWQALGNSYVIYEGDKILVLDQLPKESAQNVIMINSGGIGFSNTGIDGTFASAWTIDNILNMENINVINLTADLIKGGILKLGSNLNQYGQLEIYNEANDLIAEMNKDGFKMYGQDGSYILINNQVGLSGYDRNGTRIYWADGDAFHMKKSEVEEEITLCGKMRYIPIQITSNGTITNDGIGLVSVLGGE